MQWQSLGLCWDAGVSSREWRHCFCSWKHEPGISSGHVTRECQAKRSRKILRWEKSRRFQKPRLGPVCMDTCTNFPFSHRSTDVLCRWQSQFCLYSFSLDPVSLCPKKRKTKIVFAASSKQRAATLLGRSFKRSLSTKRRLQARVSGVKDTKRSLKGICPWTDFFNSFCPLFSAFPYHTSSSAENWYTHNIDWFPKR